MSKEKQRPESVPEEAGTAFASHVMEGVNGGHDGMPGQTAGRSSPPFSRRRKLSVDDYVQGVLSGNRTILAQTITLVESNAPRYIEMAQEVIKQLLPYTGRSIRIGITGVPGAGKSTLIETFGCMLCEQGRRVAVLAVDPSSSVTRGSILGDKTRMDRLSRQPNAFIRPSPSGGTLGGVTRKSRETILVCEAAGFDTVLVETVGVGQSETTVRSMTDFFLLVMLTGAGDELQGIKKGVIELADALLINKADGDNIIKAQVAKEEYNRVLHYLKPASEGWMPEAYTCSALTGAGVAHIWDVVERFRHQMQSTGTFEKRRKSQVLEWVYTMVQEHLQTGFFNDPNVKKIIPGIEQQVSEGSISATIAAKELLAAYEKG